jgi:hypothetical protein
LSDSCSILRLDVKDIVACTTRMRLGLWPFGLHVSFCTIEAQWQAYLDVVQDYLLNFCYGRQTDTRIISTTFQRLQHFCPRTKRCHYSWIPSDSRTQQYLVTPCSHNSIKLSFRIDRGQHRTAPQGKGEIDGDGLSSRCQTRLQFANLQLKICTSWTPPALGSSTETKWSSSACRE